MTIVSVVSIKGGVGKSTLTASLATAIARRLGDHRVIAIDLDPQNNLSWHLGLGSRRSKGIVNAAAGSAGAVPSTTATSGVRCIAFGEGTDAQLQALESRLADEPGWLTGQVGRGGSDAVALVDTPSGISVCQQHAIAASRIVLTVLQPDAASFATLPDMQQSLGRHAARADCFYLLNKFDPHDAFAIDSAALLRERFGERLVPTFVRQNEGIREALALQQTCLQHDPHGQASHDIDLVGRWLLERLGDEERR